MTANTLFDNIWYKTLQVGNPDFVVTCTIVALGLPLTLRAMFGLYSQVRNGEVAPIYVINLLLSDLVQFCLMIAAVVPPEKYDVVIVLTHVYIYCLMASVGFMVCIALERYLLIVHPLWYRCRRTIKSSVLICVVVWFLPAISVVTEYFQEDLMASIVLASIFFLLPLPLLVFFLAATIRALCASISITTDEKRRVAGMLILVLLIYLLLFLPGVTLFLILFSPTFFNPNVSLLRDLVPAFLKVSPLTDLVLYIFMRKGALCHFSAPVCCCRKESNEISTVTVNEVHVSAATDGERAEERTEEG